MTDLPEDNLEIILVDFKGVGGSVGQVRSISPEEISKQLVEQSQRSVNAAMGTIRLMANRTIAMLDTMANKPSQVEVEFGIKLDAKAGALLASAGAEGSLKVKLVWNRDKE
ncbi:CU044_2847 family protein [Pseudanabaena sp. Chao 1811]|uniref:CU044_2847 family protein n=1 Tax=Pseudanabaena sp. Chao 1811 TaxID=2963092 RepID=UPI0022F39ABB|nr:CU044_2847 family protein [Pseudanabaena sp. Chao 1811]